jgi:urea transporter
MSNINWSQVGSTLAGLTSALSAAGVTSSAIPGLLNTIGLAANPNESAEIAMCSQLLSFAGNPAVEGELAMKLATEQGIPQDAAQLALTLTQPGVDIPTRVLQIEQLIKAGG